MNVVRHISAIKVSAKVIYLPLHSSPEHHQFVFQYTISIYNGSAEQVTIWSREWNITDASGHTIQVKGAGIVGETPCIAPGSTHTYSSFCNFNTEWGKMQGCYWATDVDGNSVKIEIPSFLLHTLALLN